MLPNGEVLCACCGGIYPINEIYVRNPKEDELLEKYTCSEENAEIELLKVYKIWVDFTESIID